MTLSIERRKKKEEEKKTKKKEGPLILEVFHGNSPE